MLVRMTGCDAEMEFSPELLEVMQRAEEAFPAPEFSVVFADAQDEDEDDTLMISRRYGSVLIPVAYLTFDEIEGYDAEGRDWLAEVATDLSRTQDEIDALLDEED